MPTLATVSEVFSPQVQQADPHIPVQVSVESASQAHTIGVCLLSTSLSSLLPGVKQTPKGGLRSFELSWTLDCLTRFWHTLKLTQVPLASEYPANQCLAVFLEVLCDVLHGVISIKYDATNILRTSTLLSQILGVLIRTLAGESIEVFEKQICLAILEIVRLGQYSPIVSQVFEEHLLPILVDATKNHNRFADFGWDLQV